MSTQNSDLPIKVPSPAAETSAGVTEPKNRKQERLTTLFSPLAKTERLSRLSPKKAGVQPGEA